MAQQFVETIKIKEGEAQAIAYHQERLERTLRHFFPSLCNAPSMPSLEKLVAPTADMDFYKARVVYGEQGVKDITYAAYTMREIRSLQVVENDAITYDYKSADRSSLNALVAQKGDCDEIIIVKHGLLTDTSFTSGFDMAVASAVDSNGWISSGFDMAVASAVDSNTSRVFSFMRDS